MESQFHQLRFDISEKVRLHPQQPGIGTLLELDLYPDVEIKDEGQHLKIQGYLRLNGAYHAENPFAEEDVHVHMDFDTEANRQELAYVIPVEITLPADRAELDHIATEVETFDYQVISPFELQIEAILMIDGIIPEQKEEIPHVEEQMVASPDPDSSTQTLSIFGEEESLSEQKSASLEQGSVPIQQEHVSFQPENEQIEPVYRPAQLPPSPPVADQTHQYLRVEEDQDLTVKPVFKQEKKEKRKEKETETDSETDSAFQPQTATEFWHERQESKQEIKLNHEKVYHFESEEKQEEEHATKQETVDSMPESQEVVERIEEHTGVEWINWLVRNKEENFVPIRMVIIQKEDSIDRVAERYQISADQLIRLNQLQTDRLEEGQIIYIPRQAESKSI